MYLKRPAGGLAFCLFYLASSFTNKGQPQDQPFPDGTAPRVKKSMGLQPRRPFQCASETADRVPVSFCSVCDSFTLPRQISSITVFFRRARRLTSYRSNE